MDIGQMLGIIAVALATWFLGAVIVVGFMQTAKKVVPIIDKLPSWALALIMVAFSIGVAFARGVMAPGLASEGGPIWEGFGIAAVSQICYDSIYQAILKRGAKFVDSEPPAASGASA